MTGAPVRVLVSRPHAADPFCHALREAGFSVLPAGLTATELAPDDERARVMDLIPGAVWLVLTSPTAVRVLAQTVAEEGWELREVAAGVQVAAVGRGTARALEEVGVGVDLVPPEEQATAEGLAAIFPEPPADMAVHRAVLPGSALASPALSDSLARQWWGVQRVPLYTTVTGQLDPQQRAELSEPWPDVAVVTSGSNARALVELLGIPPAHVRLVAIGEPSAVVVRELGLTPAAVASAPTPEGVLAAVREAAGSQ